jgi:hypothetical protein
MRARSSSKRNGEHALKPIEHVVEGEAELGHLVGPLDLDAAGKVALPDGARRLGDQADRAQQPASHRPRQRDATTRTDPAAAAPTRIVLSISSRSWRRKLATTNTPRVVPSPCNGTAR